VSKGARFWGFLDSRVRGVLGGKACVEATRSAVAGHPFDGVMKTNSQSALGGRAS
jgi:hypothetical protein